MEFLTDIKFTKDINIAPANLYFWPSLRVAALIIDLLMLVVLVLLWIIPRIVYKTDHIGDEDGILKNVSDISFLLLLLSIL